MDSPFLRLKKPVSILLAGLLLWPAGFSATASAEPAPAGKSAPSPRKEPLIEISVDSLEISDGDSSNIGFNWLSGLTDAQGNSLIPANQLNFVEQGPVPPIFTFNNLERFDLITGRINLMIQNNQARILANPTLLTKSGFEASFLVGGEQPFPTPGQLNQVGVEFKKFGVSLKVLPELTDHGTIDAQINVGVSDVDQSRAITVVGTTVPGITSRETSTKVEVKDGETVVISGIKQSKRTKVIRRVPILGYIPILGFFFRNKTEEVTQSSVVVFVTFRLIK